MYFIKIVKTGWVVVVLGPVVALVDMALEVVVNRIVHLVTRFAKAIG